MQKAETECFQHSEHLQSPDAHYSITLSLSSVYILVHTHTYIHGYLIPVRDLLPRKSQNSFGIQTYG